jgi:hypothetical protein
VTVTLATAFASTPLESALHVSDPSTANPAAQGRPADQAARLRTT